MAVPWLKFCHETFKIQGQMDNRYFAWPDAIMNWKLWSTSHFILLSGERCGKFDEMFVT